MQKHKNINFIPVLTSEAGSCLTGENWEEIGIHTGSYHLQALLMKPGLSLLHEIKDLATYVGWQQTIVLNASLLNRNKEGDYTLRSQYDGSRTQYTIEQILALIAHLKPNMVLLPQGVQRYDKNAWQLLPDTILPFFSSEEGPIENTDRLYGIYFIYDKEKETLSDLLTLMDRYKDRPCYVAGDLSLSAISVLANAGVRYIESDRPVLDAYKGLVYDQTQAFSLEDEAQGLQFDVIDTTCQCPTCTQGFTRAYLHHLFEHTPLLCQRLLIQHNVYQQR